MTDHDPLDDLASAHLDGATTPEEAARVAADPALQARVDALRSLRDQLRQVPEPSAAARHAAISAALDAYDEGAPPQRTSVVTPLVARRRGPSPRVVRVLGAAAVIALLALLIPALGRLAPSDSADDAGTSFDETGAAVSGEDGGSSEARDAAGGDTTTSSAAPPFALGEFRDVDQLTEALSGTPSEQGFAPAADADSNLLESAADPDCTAPRAAAAARGEVTELRASIGAVPVLVLVITAADGGRTLVVLQADDCTELARRPL